MSAGWNSIKRMLGAAVPTSIAVLAMSGGTAMAQTYELDGSDALAEVIQNAITASGARIHYNSKGSAQAEKNIASLGGARFLQGIAPMSRNFTTEVLAAHRVGLDNWTPDDQNVLAIDAAVMCVGYINGACANISVPLQNSQDPTLAAPNSDLAIIMAGYPAPCIGVRGACTATSKATTAECAAPERLAALGRLTSCQGVNRINHLYRRDDLSGTQDTFRERLQTDRWCNGRSNGPSNLDNEDLDPIRRPCIGADSTNTQSRCTYYPTSQTCTAGSANITHPAYGTIKCTQGLVVALSENDPGSKDITLSIANRIAADLNGFTIGLIGHACVDVPNGVTTGTNINTVTYEDGNIRAGQYMLSRRLFLQRNPNYLNVVGADAGRNTEEMKLFNWATNRCQIKQIVVDAGFLPPLSTCSAACDDPQNITCLAPDSGLGTPSQNIGAEGETAPAVVNLTTDKYPCVADGNIVGDGTTLCPVLPALGTGYKCNLNSKCSAGSHVCTLDGTLLSGVCQ